MVTDALARLPGVPGHVCGFCDRYANMTYVDGRSLSRGFGDDVEVIGVYSCDSCLHLSIATVQSERRNLGSSSVESTLEHMDEFLDWMPRKGVGKTFDDVPQAIGNAASEVHACLSINANRAAIALARAVVEATAKDKGITTGNLQSKIDALATQNLIREHTRLGAHEVRLDGNEVAHGDLTAQPPSAEEAAETVALMDEILQEVYQGPARVARVQANRIRRQDPTQQS